ncbi:hypothetical protein [Chitinophaga pinensis]|uniref:Uncharacterized protein n=1 Tax=Chitinophaga pinensis (strain ATCC 43595 / DSM 2588 / LMG 13176 / NBRC 15968 / NCIMB 11800 / UQM 2034) TaxID=485918 RepID=A0A979G470_CHIPD|nr:hypothetical protein [Chitinophaga pinensis]ACU60480.1 hypothetical protein Cpin_3004 [Chitinophaga pinensis DSM 2588]
MAKSTRNSTESDSPKARGRKTKSLEELKQDIASKCLSIKTLIEAGKLSRLRDLEPLFSKAMADEMGVNHTRFSNKFRNPIDFGIKEIYRFGLYIEVDPQLIFRYIGKEISQANDLLSKLKKFRTVEDMRQYSSKQ